MTTVFDSRTAGEKDTASLRSLIQTATSVQQVDALLAMGGSYRDAAPATRRKWRKAAEIRKAQLTGEVR